MVRTVFCFQLLPHRFRGTFRQKVLVNLIVKGNIKYTGNSKAIQIRQKRFATNARDRQHRLNHPYPKERLFQASLYVRGDNKPAEDGPIHPSDVIKVLVLKLGIKACRQR